MPNQLFSDYLCQQQVRALLGKHNSRSVFGSSDTSVWTNLADFFNIKKHIEEEYATFSNEEKEELNKKLQTTKQSIFVIVSLAAVNATALALYRLWYDKTLNRIKACNPKAYARIIAFNKNYYSLPKIEQIKHIYKMTKFMIQALSGCNVGQRNRVHKQQTRRN